MTIRPLFLVLLGGLSLGACMRPANPAAPYDPSRAPLTADELASLIDMYHWKITQTPNDGKPYWGVRVVIANHGATFQPVNPASPAYQLLETVAVLRFEVPVPSNGKPDVLLGMQIQHGMITGNLSATSPGHGTSTTRFHLDHLPVLVQGKDGGMNTCSGAVWEDNRVDLIDFRDSDFKPNGAICLEFLHSAPR